MDAPRYLHQSQIILDEFKQVRESASLAYEELTSLIFETINHQNPEFMIVYLAELRKSILEARNFHRDVYPYIKYTSPHARFSASSFRVRTPTNYPPRRPNFPPPAHTQVSSSVSYVGLNTQVNVEPIDLTTGSSPSSNNNQSNTWRSHSPLRRATGEVPVDRVQRVAPRFSGTEQGFHPYQR